MTKPAKKRSPLKDPAIRNPGQSLAEARRRVWEDYGEAPAVVTACLFMVAALKWVEQATGSASPAWLWTAMMLLSLVWLVYRMIKAQPVIRALTQGEQGERAVGQFLERLREDGYQVFHDLVGDGFNLDHVIIGPAGVFTIETKTWSKPASGQPKIHFDGQTLKVPDQPEDRRPIIQAQAQASWLSALLNESTGRAIKARPVVLFPGWFIDSQQAAKTPVWVLNPKALPKFLANEPQRLQAEDIKLLSFHLSRWIRSEEARAGGRR